MDEISFCIFFFLALKFWTRVSKFLTKNLYPTFCFTTIYYLPAMSSKAFRTISTINETFNYIGLILLIFKIQNRISPVTAPIPLNKSIQKIKFVSITFSPQMRVLFSTEWQEQTRNGQNIKFGATKLTIFVELERERESKTLAVQC